MPIRGIGFDYLGVTAHMPPGDFWGDIARIFGLTVDEVRAAYRVHRLKLQLGQVTAPELWQLVAADLDQPGKAGLIRQRDGGTPTVDPQITALAGQLRTTGYRVGILSNLSGSWVDYLYAQGTHQHFDAVVVSADAGYAKPDPRAYQLLASKLGVATDELVFIDDRQEAVEGIDQLGITPILYRGYDRLVAELARHGIEVSS